MLLLYLAFRARPHAGLGAASTSASTRRASWCGGSSRTGVAREWRFEPYWVRVLMDDPPRRDSWLTLASHGLSLRVGTFLTPEERLDLARALRAALREYR